jgi:hydroxylamine reductase (hybrid-cluster protein)
VLTHVEDALDYLATAPTDAPGLLDHALGLGTLNLGVMALLDAANTGAFGTPVPTPVRVTPTAGKAVLLSGHDLHDLATVLKATAGTGINVCTHGELLPGHGYPLLRRHPHLAGNYGGAWQDQQAEFAAFPGPIVMTPNCLIEPLPAYRAASSPPGRPDGPSCATSASTSPRTTSTRCCERLRRCRASPRTGQHLGPTLPAFLTPALVDVLVTRFGLQAGTDAEAAVAAAMAVAP